MRKKSPGKDPHTDAAARGTGENTYRRRDTIESMIVTAWFINTLPLTVALFFFGSLGLIFAFPVTFIGWIFFGDKPVYKSQPMNFFYTMGFGFDVNETSGTPFMKGVFRFLYDLRSGSEYRYRGLRDYYIGGQTHPEMEHPYPLPARILGVLLYAASTVGALLFTAACLAALGALLWLIGTNIIRRS